MRGLEAAARRLTDEVRNSTELEGCRKLRGPIGQLQDDLGAGADGALAEPHRVRVVRLAQLSRHVDLDVDRQSDTGEPDLLRANVVCPTFHTTTSNTPSLQ